MLAPLYSAIASAGRAYPIVHGGTFKTLKEAKARKNLIGGLIAERRKPAEVLRSLVASPTPMTTVERWSERLLGSRIDIDANTTKNYRSALRKVGETFGDRDPFAITVDKVAAWVAAIAEKTSGGSCL